MNREDIEIINIDIDDTFQYGGRTFQGLEDLKKSAFESYNKKDKMKRPPYVVIIDHLYPCFDSEDYAKENRYYQNYYLTTDSAKAERICEETESGFSESGKPQLYPILEPAFSMGKIEEHHLPYIYHHGEGNTMQIVQNAKASAKDKITVNRPAYDFSFHDDDPPCLYGPPPGYKDEPVFIDDNNEPQDRSWLDILLGK